MATAIKETNIEVQVIGYITSYYGGEPQLRVRVSGQGPKGKLKGIVVYSDGRIDLKGDGQYSFMHGNSSLSYRAEPRFEIERLAKAAAEEWIAANPDALRLYKIEMANASIAGLKADISRAQDQQKRYEAKLSAEEERLAKLVTGVSG